MRERDWEIEYRMKHQLVSIRIYILVDARSKPRNRFLSVFNFPISLSLSLIEALSGFFLSEKALTLHLAP